MGNRQLASVAHSTAQLKAEVEASNKQIAAYKVTKAKVDSLGYVNDLANKVLPPDKEQSAIVAELTEFALRTDLQIDQISFVSTATTSNTAKGKLAIPKGVEVVPITISFSEGTQYQSVLDFLKIVENNQRKMQVTSVSIKPNEKDRSSLSSVTVSLNLYAKQATKTGTKK